jgi:hypothetical protein
MTAQTASISDCLHRKQANHAERKHPNVDAPLLPGVRLILDELATEVLGQIDPSAERLPFLTAGPR